MTRIGDLLPDAARGLGLEDELRLSRAMATFEAIVAERVPAAAGACRVLRLDGFALVVEADAPIVAQELRLRVGRAPRGVRGRRRRASAPGTFGSTSAAQGPAYNPRHLPAVVGASAIRTGIRPPSVLRRPSSTTGDRRTARDLHGRPTPDEARRRSPSQTASSTRPTPSSSSSRASGPSPARRATSTCSSPRRSPSQRAQEATQLVAETIRSEYYYDESAGIRVCIQKAITSANKRLGHQRDRLGLHGDGENGPIGIGVAVVRGNELYVGTIGPAEAYLIRQARLSTLPDPHRERGLPTSDLEPDVWRGEISVGDSLVLVSPNVMARLGPDELKDAMVTLHPQPAMEHLHHRFVAADGAGSDAMIAIEATEVAVDPEGADARPGPARGAAGRRARPRRRSRSPTT